MTEGARRPRARDLGVPFDGSPGRWNAITDVPGVEVGHVTLIRGEGRLRVGEGPIRTGVTAIHPRGKADPDPVFGGWFALNANGEMTGTAWIDDSGLLEGPVLLTNTHSLGVVRDAAARWMHGRNPDFRWALPVVAETFDGLLSDINGHHVMADHALQALDEAAAGPVAEGNVGGGTGMICHGFKGGIGTASRRVGGVGGEDDPAGEAWTLGVLAQCNHGRRSELRIAGVPVGREITDRTPCYDSELEPSQAWLRDIPRCGAGDGRPAAARPGARGAPEARGSIIVVVATDAPLLPHQLRGVARRVALGVGRVGGIGEAWSGDIFLAFSTANPGAASAEGVPRVDMLPLERIDAVYSATVQATEEAIVNALVAAETMTGADDLVVHAMPHDRLRDVLAARGVLRGSSNPS